MTGNIRSSLLSSDAVKSLMMEARIAEAFRKRDWDVERSMYYADPETLKQREIDVYCAHVLDKPKRRKGIGGPIINMSLFCECKSLSGSNIIFSQDRLPKFFGEKMQSYWLGRDQELQDITMKIALDTGIVDHARIKELYSYVIGRAYPYDGPAFIKPVQMPPPPVDLIARAFRETKGGKFNDDSSDLGRISPVWSAIRSSLSAVKSAIEVSRRTSLGWVHGIQPVFYGLDDFKRSAAFSLDAQLLRYCFYHPFITLNSKLWHLREDKLEEVNSVRLYVSTIEHESSYVDIIHEGSVEQYIDSMISHFDKNSRRSITGLWKMIDELGWAPGKEEEAFGKILGLSHDVVVK